MNISQNVLIHGCPPASRLPSTRPSERKEAKSASGDCCDGGRVVSNLAEVVPAEQDFRDVIAVAQKIRAKAPELRATMSPARLLRDTGRTPDIMGTM